MDRGERETRERDVDDDHDITQCKARMNGWTDGPGPTAAAVITRAAARTAGADKKSTTVETADENGPTVGENNSCSGDNTTDANARKTEPAESDGDALQAAVRRADRAGLATGNSDVQHEALDSAELLEESRENTGDTGQALTDITADFNEQEEHVTRTNRTDNNENGDDSEDDDDADDTAEHLSQAIKHTMQTAKQSLTADDYLTDSEFSNIYQYLQTGILSGNEKIDRKTLLLSELYVLKGVLLYRLKLPKGKRDLGLSLERLCVPKTYRAAVLFRFHDAICHGGVQKTYLSVSHRFFWQAMFTDINFYVRTCRTCQISKRHYTYRAKPLHSLEVPDRPFTHYSIDFKNLPRKTAAGNTAILCIVEIFSGYPILVACPDMSALTTAKMIIKHVICSFGTPKIINSDRGSNFTASLFRYIAKMFNIEQRISASRTSQTNGAAEALVQRVGTMIKRFEADDLEIEGCLPLIEMSLRVSSLTRMHFSPYEILYGRAMEIGDWMVDEAPIPFEGNYASYIKALRRELKEIHKNVKERKLEIKKQEQADYNKRNRVVPPQWRVGQKVLLEDRAIKRNSNVILTKRPFKGPFYILSLIHI